MSVYVEGECAKVDVPESGYDILSRRISAVSNKVTNITPYTESKTAYIGDTEVSFAKRDGTITVNMMCNGIEIPYTLEVTDRIYVRFEALDELATVNISIQ